MSEQMNVDCQETGSLEQKVEAQEGPVSSTFRVKNIDTHIQTNIVGTVSNRDDIQIDDCPAPVREFTGRQKELEELKRMFEDHQVIAVVGMGGVGKSQLVRKYAQQYKNTYQYRFWIEADTTEKLNNSFQELADKLDVKASSKNILVNDIYKAFTKGRALLIFENVVRPKHVYEYLPTRFQLTNVTVNILITSRWKDWTSIREVSMMLHCIKAEVCLHLLQILIGNESGQTGEENLMELASIMGHLPLALRLSASFIRKQQKYNSKFTIQDYITNFNRLLPRTTPGYGNNRSIYVSTVMTLESLERNSKRLVNVAAYFNPDKILKSDLVPLIPKASDLEAALADVISCSLLHDGGTDRFTMHRAIQSSIQHYQQENNKNETCYPLTVHYVLANQHSNQCDSVFAYARQYKTLIVENYKRKRSHRPVILKYLLRNRCTDVLKIIFEYMENRQYDKYNAIYIALESDCPDMFVFTLSYVEMDHDLIFYLFDKACEKDNKSIVQFLLGNRLISVTELYDDYQTLLHRAACHASSPIISLILQLNKDVIDIQNKWGNTALHTVIKSYHKISESSELCSVADMLNRMATYSLDTDTLHTDIKLRRTIPKSHVIGTVRVLIENGASVVIKNKDGCTALHYATLYKAVELVSLITQSDNTVVNIGDKNGRTALHHLCMHHPDGSEEHVIDIARDLIKNGAIVVTRDGDGCTALHYATLYKAVQLVSLITQLDNTVVNIVDNKGCTALHRLCMHYPDGSEARAIDIARVLIKNGASVVARDSTDRTALHIAASYAHAQLVSLLIESNKEVIDIVDNRSNTALHLVASNYYGEETDCVQQTISILIENDLSIHNLNSDGKSPLDTTRFKYKQLLRRLADEHEKATRDSNGTI